MASSESGQRDSINSLRAIDREQFINSIQTHLKSIKDQQTIATTCSERYTQVFWYLSGAYSDKRVRKPPLTSAAFPIWLKEVADLQESLERERKVYDNVCIWKNYLDDWVAVLIALEDLWEVMFDAVDANAEDGVRDIQERMAIEEEKASLAAAGTMEFGRLVLMYAHI